MPPSRWSLGLVLLPGGRDWLPVALGLDPDATPAAAYRWAGRRLGQANPEVRVEAVVSSPAGRKNGVGADGGMTLAHRRLTHCPTSEPGYLARMAAAAARQGLACRLEDGERVRVCRGGVELGVFDGRRRTLTRADGSACTVAGWQAALDVLTRPAGGRPVVGGAGGGIV